MAQSFLLSPNGLTLTQKARAGARARTRGNRGNHRRADNEASMSMDALGDDDLGTEPRSQRRRRA